jgi:hypothetical protein
LSVDLKKCLPVWGVLLLTAILPAEVLKISLLKQKPAIDYGVKRNIFTLLTAPLVMAKPQAPPALEIEAPPPPDPGAEVRQAVAYEGFLTRDGKNSAMITAGGDFFTVSAGETILDKFKIVTIQPERITVEYQGQIYEIAIKGVTNGSGQ